MDASVSDTPRADASRDAASSSKGHNDAASQQECISVVARVRPSREPSESLSFHEKVLQVSIPRSGGDGTNKQDAYRFPFQRILGPKVTQAEVFNTVARDLILGAVEGVNCTIFAYGQTGSGKTFTICGGKGSYEDRGIIPRALGLIFDEIDRKQEEGVEYAVKISFIEVYKEVGIDLLAKDFGANRESWPVVTVSLQSGQPELQGAKCISIASEDEGLHQYFLGDTHRTVAETPHNLNSSRSHCIFTVYIEASDAVARTVRRSKVQIVDLAGSERLHPYETGSQNDKVLMSQAVSINMSLHFLEAVINALNQGKKAGVVPYRNSFLTKLLKDALGGNARAMMVTTINPEDGALPETISSCRFAQRVAKVQTDARVNEEQDPQLMIQALKQENEEIKAALSAAQGGENVEPMSEEELRSKIKAYLAADGAGAEARSDLGVRALRDAFVAFRIFREQCWELVRSKLAAAAGMGSLATTPRAVAEAESTPGDMHASQTSLANGSSLTAAPRSEQKTDSNGKCTSGAQKADAALRAALEDRERECKMLRAALAAQMPKPAPATKPVRAAAPRPVTKVNAATQTEGVPTPRSKPKAKRPTSADPRPKGMRTFIDFSPEDVVDRFNRAGSDPSSAARDASQPLRSSDPRIPDFRRDAAASQPLGKSLSEKERTSLPTLPPAHEQMAAAKGRRPSQDSGLLDGTSRTALPPRLDGSTTSSIGPPAAAAVSASAVPGSGALPAAAAVQGTTVPKAVTGSTSLAWLRATTALTVEELALLSSSKEAYQVFLQHDPRAADIWPAELQDLRSQRRRCMEEARALGEEIEQTKQATQKVQATLESLKSRLREAENQAAVDPSQAQKASTLRDLLAGEEPKVQQIFNEKRQRYELDFNRLKELRREISHLEHGEKKLEATIQAEYATWRKAVDERYEDALKNLKSNVAAEGAPSAATAEEYIIETPDTPEPVAPSPGLDSSRNPQLDALKAAEAALATLRSRHQEAVDAGDTKREQTLRMLLQTEEPRLRQLRSSLGVD